MKKAINFNELAWNAPKHDDSYGYLPSDNFYTEIVEWLRQGTRLYRERVGNITTTRLSYSNSNYDVVATFDHSTKLIWWVFREQSSYEI